MKSIPIISLLVVAALLCMAVVARDVETTTDQAPAKSMETTMSKRTISGTGHDITPLSEEQVAELAASAGISHKRLKTVFPAHTGLPVFEYLQERRMQIASQSLRDTTIPITEIALAIGYGSLSHFSALFKRRFGLSPSYYRTIMSERR